MTDFNNLDGTQNTVNTVNDSSADLNLENSGTVSGNTESIEDTNTVPDNQNPSDISKVNDGDKPKRHGMDNLIPFTALTEEEQRQMAIKGGKASGEARRKKKHMREIAQNLLAHNMREDQIEEVLGTAKDLLDGDLSVAAVLTARMIQEAADGNYKAFEVLRDTAGYKPKDQVEVENISEADKLLLERIAQRVGLHNPVNTNQITG